MSETLHYARRSPSPSAFPRWLLYVFSFYVAVSVWMIIEYSRDEMLASGRPISWSAHGIVQRAALFVDEGVLWSCCATLPCYVLGLIGALCGMLKKLPDWPPLVAATIGICVCLTELIAYLYLSAAAPFLIMTTDGSIRIYDRVHWGDALLRVAVQW